MQLDEAEYSTFASRIAETFLIRRPEGEKLEFTLSAVTLLSTAVADESFSLVFRGPREQALAQGIYDFEHPELGVLPLFVVPTGIDAEGREYEVIFNRLPPPAPATPS